MSVSVRTRFEVLKRDRYTCSYCGKHPPDVLLEVDHIHPVAAGGTDEMENLTTACTDCNRGKGARLLEEGTAPVIRRSSIQEMQERIEQAKAYMELQGTLRSIADEQVHRVTMAWAEAFGATVEEHPDGHYWKFGEYAGNWPDERSIRSFLKKLPLDQILDAVDIVRGRFRHPTMDSVRYFYGCCHTAIREGREPSSRQQQPSQASLDAWFDEGESFGRSSERTSIGEILRNYIDHGYETLADAVYALFPDPD